ncbi:MAG: outer membrane protein assembly factor BamD [Gallionellaceae bacterium]|jgi:outer membrane protein assembly factor BamD|nr:outer membrane protein assembly factor BamD [Gallionellaceae bacterium]
MRHSLALILALTLTACGIFSKDTASEEDIPSVEQLYADAREAMDNNNYTQALVAFDRLQASYPYGRYAQQALLESAYANYKQKESEAALSAIDRFIKQYPNNPHVDYAYYLRGLVSFNDDLGLFGDITEQDLSERDPNAGRNAFDALKELVTKFPDSKYAPDARLRMQYLINELARYEIHVAQYYLRRGAYVAAAARAKDVLTNYPETPETRDALRVLIRAYDGLGMTDMRDDAKRVLEANALPADAMRGNMILESTQESSWWEFWKRDDGLPWWQVWK